MRACFAVLLPPRSTNQTNKGQRAMAAKKKTKKAGKKATKKAGKKKAKR